MAREVHTERRTGRCQPGEACAWSLRSRSRCRARCRRWRRRQRREEAGGVTGDDALNCSSFRSSCLLRCRSTHGPVQRWQPSFVSRSVLASRPVRRSSAGARLAQAWRCQPCGFAQLDDLTWQEVRRQRHGDRDGVGAGEVARLLPRLPLAVREVGSGDDRAAARSQQQSRRVRARRRDDVRRRPCAARARTSRSTRATRSARSSPAPTVSSCSR